MNPPIQNSNVLNRIQSPGPKKILACDGGGILGLMSVEILARLEDQLRQALGKGEEFVLADYFDFVCGTSTGAIIATCIASGMSMARVRQFYLDSGKQMFDKASLLKRLKYDYNKEPLAELLKSSFDEQLQESAATLGSANLKTLLMMVMRNHTTDSPWPVSNNPFAKYNGRERKDCNLNLPLWQLVRASTAAPTYFPPEIVTFAEGTPDEYNFIFVDGGVTTYNNPAWLAFQMATARPYAINWQTGADKLMIVSVGTGSVANANPNLKVDEMNLLYFAKNIPSALMNAASAGWDMTCRLVGECRHGRPIDREFGDMVVPCADGLNWTGSKLFAYLRYDPDVSFEGLHALGLGDINPANVQLLDSVDHIGDIRRVGSAYAEKNCFPEHFEGFLA
ncbi:patatin-like phospholipase family protein [Methylomicrobium sp. RS1]|uniref:patatin-like phospholipase family protein n=1 Tax=Candidatus Methylomicrobium oryzae TaxID=2802053 RepID=UPI001920AA6D|nr:patatin-like phospholipase family protein [Methylomicrobium sp. RS1]MBL1263822.1 patatin-like phospholipase family protein [Methylomicrobium sp. RS1]